MRFKNAQQSPIDTAPIDDEVIDNYVDNDDQVRLVPEETGQSSKLAAKFAKHKKKTIASGAFLVALILFSIGLATYFIYFHGRVRLHVFEFNVWGMPGGLGGCKYKQQRMQALADLIRSRQPYFDIFMLEELWMQSDHTLLEDAAKSVGLYMTGFRQLASG